MTSVEVLKQFMASKYLSPVEVVNNRAAVLATYRHLLRATRIAFHGMRRQSYVSTLHILTCYIRRRRHSGSLS